MGVDAVKTPPLENAVTWIAKSAKCIAIKKTQKINLPFGRFILQYRF
jgi:hypothetical protein